VEVVETERLRPGQVVAEPVTNESGAVLCPEGHSLDQESIQRLQQAGVVSVQVVIDEAAAAALQQRLAQLEKRFKGIDDPCLLRLKAAVLDVLAPTAES
jgi:hypothetical protein